MLEIRYNKHTNELTGWWGSRHGNHTHKLKNRPDEVITTLNLPIPDKPIEAWLYFPNNDSLTLSGDYIEPPPREP